MGAGHVLSGCLPVSARGCKGGGCRVRGFPGVVGGRGLAGLPAPIVAWSCERATGSTVGRRPIAQATPQAPLTRSPGSVGSGGGAGRPAGGRTCKGGRVGGAVGSFLVVGGAGRGSQAYLGPRIDQGVLVIRRHDDRLVGPARRGRRPLSLCRPSRCWPARRAWSGPTAPWQELAACASVSGGRTDVHPDAVSAGLGPGQRLVAELIEQVHGAADQLAGLGQGRALAVDAVLDAGVVVVVAGQLAGVGLAGLIDQPAL